MSEGIQTVTSDVTPVEPPVDAPAPEVVGSEPSAEPSQDQPTGEPSKEPGSDQTPPWLKAEITKERNRRRAAEDRTKKLEEQIDRLTKAVGERTESKPAEASQKPNRNDFFDPDEYEAALTEWITETVSEKVSKQQEEKSTRTRAEQDQQRQIEEAQKSWSAQAEAAKKLHPDFDEVVYSDDFRCSTVMMNAIAADIHGAEVAYHLATNPDAADAINALPPVQQIIEIGRLSATLQAKPATEPRRAPAPIRPLGNEAPAVKKTAEEESEAEYFARRNAEAKANRERLY